MNSILIDKDNIDKLNTYNLSIKSSNALRKNITININDNLKGTIIDEGPCSLKVINNQESIKVLIQERYSFKSFPIELILGASRPQTMKKIFEHGTCMGIQSFNILKSQLSEKSYLQSKIYHSEQLRDLINLGLSQSTFFFKKPIVNKYYSFSKIIPNNNAQKFIFSPYASSFFDETLLDFETPISIAVGPERGWTSKEVEHFKEIGYKEVRLGFSILRVEIALFSILGIINKEIAKNINFNISKRI